MKSKNLVMAMSLALSFSTTVVAAEASFNASAKAIKTAQTNFKQVDSTKAKAWENKSASGEDYCKISLNGEDVKAKLTDKILILNDRTFLPLRAIGDLIGANAYWDETNKVAKIEYKNTAIEMSNNSNKIVVNGSTTAEVSKGDPNTATFISPTNDRMYLPIRAIAENLDGVEIRYFSKAGSQIQYIVIRTDGKPITEPEEFSKPTQPTQPSKPNIDEPVYTPEHPMIDTTEPYDVHNGEKMPTYKGKTWGELSPGGNWSWQYTYWIEADTGSVYESKIW